MDPKTQQVINLPENYLAVAARIASTSYQLGLLERSRAPGWSDHASGTTIPKQRHLLRRCAAYRSDSIVTRTSTLALFSRRRISRRQDISLRLRPQ